MDIKSYISSGIIEACLTGIATEEDVRQMEILSEKYPEIKSEIDKVQQTLVQLSFRHAVAPPKYLKETIWTKLNNKSSQDNPQPTVGISNTDTTAPASRATKTIAIWKYYAAAAVILIVISSYFSISIYQNNTTLSKHVVALEQRLKDNHESYRTELSTYQESLSGLVNGHLQGILLKGTELHPQMTAIVLWNKKSNEVYLSLKHLPVPPKGKQYQLWSIVDGKPVSAGVYESQPENKDLQKMKVVSPQTQLFAVTLEKEGGVSSPTLSAMYVSGKL